MHRIVWPGQSKTHRLLDLVRYEIFARITWNFHSKIQCSFHTGIILSHDFYIDIYVTIDLWIIFIEQVLGYYINRNWYLEIFKHTWALTLRFMYVSNSTSHFSTWPLAAEVLITSSKTTCSPSEEIIEVTSMVSVKCNFAIPSKHFFRWGCTLKLLHIRRKMCGNVVSNYYLHANLMFVGIKTQNSSSTCIFQNKTFESRMYYWWIYDYTYVFDIKKFMI